MIDKDEQERELKRQKERERIAMLSYNEQEEAIKKKSYTSFGKLILAEEKSQPIYSLGKADRNVVTGEFVSLPKYTPGPKYNIPDVVNYKFSTDHKWRIGSAQRAPLKPKYAHYLQKYDPEKDLSRFPKKWNKVVGGDIAKDPRIKYDYREKTPGPGRYTPSVKLTRPKSANYFIGEKTGNSSLKLFTGTNKTVGPGKYRPETAKYHSHHPKFPEYSIGKAVRPPLYPKPWTQDESYWYSSSMGVQVDSKKKTEEMVKIGKSTRDREKLRGTFKCMMERAPAQVRIPMPKF